MNYTTPAIIVVKPDRVVESGYDEIHQLYHERRVKNFWSVRPDINALVKRLSKGDSILDVGCGSGYIASILEKQGFKVTGIDVSRKMLELAKKNAPSSRFLKMDMRTLGFPPRSFDGVICLYSIIHVPRRFHQGILKGFHRVLKPGGLLATHMGWTDYVGTEEDWLGGGATMYWSHDVLEPLRQGKKHGDVARGGFRHHIIKGLEAEGRHAPVRSGPESPRLILSSKEAYRFTGPVRENYCRPAPP